MVFSIFKRRYFGSTSMAVASSATDTRRFSGFDASRIVFPAPRGILDGEGRVEGEYAM